MIKDAMQIAREVKSTELSDIQNEVFDLIKNDSAWLTDIVRIYVENITPDVYYIKKMVDEYNNPVVEEEPAE